MEPPAPPRLSASTFWPQYSVSFCAITRPTMSVALPAGNVMMTRTGRFG
jgi:hypothetical protein